MLTLQRPYCGMPADKTELAPGYEAHLNRFDPVATPEEFEPYMSASKKPKVIHLERWSIGQGNRAH